MNLYFDLVKYERCNTLAERKEMYHQIEFDYLSDGSPRQFTLSTRSKFLKNRKVLCRFFLYLCSFLFFFSFRSQGREDDFPQELFCEIKEEVSDLIETELLPTYHFEVLSGETATDFRTRLRRDSFSFKFREKSLKKTSSSDFKKKERISSSSTQLDPFDSISAKPFNMQSLVRDLAKVEGVQMRVFGSNHTIVEQGCENPYIFR